jgi:hypothetical protein
MGVGGIEGLDSKELKKVCVPLTLCIWAMLLPLVVIVGFSLASM